MEYNFNPSDTLTFDVPTFIRMLEYAKEDAQTDMDLHKVTENALILSQSNRILKMANYEDIVNGNKDSIEEQIYEVRRMQYYANIKN